MDGIPFFFHSMIKVVSINKNYGSCLFSGDSQFFTSIKKKTPAFARYFNHTNPGGVNAFWARFIQKL
jgi:hypothetical protein